MEILEKTMKNVRKNRVIIIFTLIIVLFLGGFFTGRVIFEEKKVFIPGYIVEQFNSIYDEEQQETVLCLIGKKTLKGWEITETIRPKLIQKGMNSVSYESCGAIQRKNVLGQWHNHKNGLCELSDSDIFSFGQDYSDYNIELSIVQCGSNRLGIFTKEIINVEGYTFEQDSLKYEVI